MDESKFKKKLNEIIREMDSVPQPQRNKLILLAKKTQDSHEKLKEKVNELQHSLDYLRVSIKYLIFDLEATRRENAHYKKLLEEGGSGKG